jgi:hypothetical protein
MVLLMMASSFCVALGAKLNICTYWAWIHTVNLKLSIALLAFLHVFIEIAKRAFFLLNTTSTIIERPSFSLCYLCYTWKFQCKNSLKYSNQAMILWYMFGTLAFTTWIRLSVYYFQFMTCPKAAIAFIFTLILRSSVY